MRYCISDRKNAKAEDPDIRVTNSYIEVEVPIDNNSSVFTYIVPKGEHAAFVLMCLDDMFDNLLENMDEDTIETVCNTWPTLAEMLHNGIKDKYSNGALIKLEDADDGDTKWFMASIAGNISFESAESIFCDRTNEAMGVVWNRTITLLTELQERKPSQWRAMGKGILSGLALGALAIAADALGIDLNVVES
jgi:hypothetical protein